MNYSVNPKSILNKLDCTFYFILNDKDITKTLKEATQRKICEKFEELTGARFYGMRTGPDIRSGIELKKEFSQTIPEQVKIIYLDIEEDEVSLLSTLQRDAFFDEILSLEEDADTLPIVQKILNEIE